MITLAGGTKLTCAQAVKTLLAGRRAGGQAGVGGSPCLIQGRLFQRPGQGWSLGVAEM
jgi:hypothetical protein